MKVLVQWTRPQPQDWEHLDSSRWRGTQGKPYCLNVQGTEFSGYDHYAVEHLLDGACRVVAWKDDPEDYSPSKFFARSMTFFPLSPDPSIGGAYNTHRSRTTIYAAPFWLEYYARLGPIQNTEIKPWEAFRPPGEVDTRHGVWIKNEDVLLYTQKRTSCNWRDWTEGLPKEEIVDSKLRDQRPLGRFRRAKGTKTFGLRDLIQASGVHATSNANYEDQMTRDAFGASELESENLGGGASELTHLWTTLTTEPNDSDWPSGNYRCSMDISTVGADITFGLRTAGAVTGHFARVNSGLSSDLETFAQTEALFGSPAGIKVATTGTIDPAAGAAVDRFECLLAATRTADHGNQPLEVRYSSDSWADGPWTVAAGQAAALRTLGITGAGI